MISFLLHSASVGFMCAIDSLAFLIFDRASSNKAKARLKTFFAGASNTSKILGYY